MGNHIPTFNGIFASKLKPNLHALTKWNYNKVVEAWSTFICYSKGSVDVDKALFHKITALLMFQSDQVFNSIVSQRKKTIDVVEVLVGIVMTSNMNRKTKLMMVFSMFDFRNEKSLEESTFVYMFRYIIRALCRFYDTRMPPLWELDTQSRAMFSILDLRFDREESISIEKWMTLMLDTDVRRFLNNIDGDNVEKLCLSRPIRFDPALSMKEYFRLEINKIRDDMDPDLRDAKLSHRPRAELLHVLSVIVSSLEYASLTARIIALVHNSGNLSRDLLEVAVHDKQAEVGDRSVDQKKSAAIRANMMLGLKAGSKSTSPNPAAAQLVNNIGSDQNPDVKKATEIFTRTDAVTTIVDTKIQDFVIRCIENEFPTLTGKVFGQETDKICAAAVKNAWLGESHAGVSIEGPATLTMTIPFIHGIPELTLLPGFDEGIKTASLKIYAYKKLAVNNQSSAGDAKQKISSNPFPLANTERSSKACLIQGKSSNIDFKAVIDVLDVASSCLRVELIVCNNSTDAQGLVSTNAVTLARCDISVETLIKGDMMVGEGSLFHLNASDPIYKSSFDLRMLSFNMSAVIAAKRRAYPKMDHQRFAPWMEMVSKPLALDNCSIFIDPLDGTKLFLDKKEHCVTNVVGICVNGEPVAGVIHYPFLGSSGKTYVGIVGVGMFSPHAVDLFKPKMDEIPLRLSNKTQQQQVFDGDVLLSGGYVNTSSEKGKNKNSAQATGKTLLTNEQLKKLDNIIDDLNVNSGSQTETAANPPVSNTNCNNEGTGMIVGDGTLNEGKAAGDKLNPDVLLVGSATSGDLPSNISNPISFNSATVNSRHQSVKAITKTAVHSKDDPNYDPFAAMDDFIDDNDPNNANMQDDSYDVNDNQPNSDEGFISATCDFDGAPPLEWLGHIEPSKRDNIVVRVPKGFSLASYLSSTRWASRKDKIRLQRGERIAVISDKADDPFLDQLITRMKPNKVIHVGGAAHKLVHLLDGKADFCILAGTDKFDTCGSEAILKSIGGGLKTLKCLNVDYSDMSAMNNGGVMASAENSELNMLLKHVGDMRNEGMKTLKELNAEKAISEKITRGGINHNS